MDPLFLGGIGMLIGGMRSRGMAGLVAGMNAGAAAQNAKSRQADLELKRQKYERQAEAQKVLSAVLAGQGSPGVPAVPGVPTSVQDPSIPPGIVAPGPAPMGPEPAPGMGQAPVLPPGAMPPGAMPPAPQTPGSMSQDLSLIHI